MNTVVIITAWLAVGISLVFIFIGPYLIDTERDKFTAKSYVIGLFAVAIDIVLVGRVFGWW